LLLFAVAIKIDFVINGTIVMQNFRGNLGLRAATKDHFINPHFLSLSRPGEKVR
jgi:hypothetical protein